LNDVDIDRQFDAQGQELTKALFSQNFEALYPVKKQAPKEKEKNASERLGSNNEGFSF